MSKYQKIIKDNAIIHLKTDSFNLYQYTLDVVKANSLELIEYHDDIYGAKLNNEVTQIKTFYEQMFLEEGSKITYIKFRLVKNKNLKNPPFREIPGYKY